MEGFGKFGSHWSNQWRDVSPNGARGKEVGRELLPKLQLHTGSVLQLNPSLKMFKPQGGFKLLFKARCVPELIGHESGIAGITTGITNTSAGRNSAAQDRPPVPLKHLGVGNLHEQEF